MRYSSIILLCGLLFTVNISRAQNSILAGKVVDDVGRPVAGAVITLDNSTMVSSNEDGLYYTSPLAAATYEVAIAVNGQKLIANTVALPDMRKTRQYYNFVVTGISASAQFTGKDPFMEAAIAKVDADSNNVMMMDGMRMGKYNLEDPKNILQQSRTTAPHTIQTEHVPGQLIYIAPSTFHAEGKK